jgi:hypothetical protein
MPRDKQKVFSASSAVSTVKVLLLWWQYGIGLLLGGIQASEGAETNGRAEEETKRGGGGYGLSEAGMSKFKGLTPHYNSQFKI